MKKENKRELYARVSRLIDEVKAMTDAMDRTSDMFTLWSQKYSDIVDLTMTCFLVKDEQYKLHAFDDDDLRCALIYYSICDSITNFNEGSRMRRICLIFKENW